MFCAPPRWERRLFPNPPFDDATLTFCLHPFTGPHKSINESVLFSRGSVRVKVSVIKLLLFQFFFLILTLLKPPSPFQINIQKRLIKNLTPYPPPEQDKQIRGCVCSLLAHPILYILMISLQPLKRRKKKNARWHDAAAECDIKR